MTVALASAAVEGEPHRRHQPRRRCGGSPGAVKRLADRGGGSAGVPARPASAARWLAGDVAQQLQELGLLAEGAGGSLADERGSMTVALASAAVEGEPHRRQALGHKERGLVAVGASWTCGSPTAAAVALATSSARLGARRSVARPRRRPGAAGAREPGLAERAGMTAAMATSKELGTGVLPRGGGESWRRRWRSGHGSAGAARSAASATR
jgi:hypothetical protein